MPTLSVKNVLFAPDLLDHELVSVAAVGPGPAWRCSSTSLPLMRPIYGWRPNWVRRWPLSIVASAKRLADISADPDRLSQR